MSGEEVRSARELLSITTAEKILISLTPEDGVQRARYRSLMYQLREMRMASEVSSGKMADDVKAKADIIAGETIKRMSDTNVR